MTGRTYRYMTEESLYPFGFGLSYTTFAYRDLPITTPGSSGFDVAVTLENTGTVAADKVEFGEFWCRLNTEKRETSELS